MPAKRGGGNVAKGPSNTGVPWWQRRKKASGQASEDNSAGKPESEPSKETLKKVGKGNKDNSAGQPDLQESKPSNAPTKSSRAVGARRELPNLQSVSLDHGAATLFHQPRGNRGGQTNSQGAAVRTGATRPSQAQNLLPGCLHLFISGGRPLQQVRHAQDFVKDLWKLTEKDSCIELLTEGEGKTRIEEILVARTFLLEHQQRSVGVVVCVD
eukprot:464362-Rhodomonas_salina.1